MSTRLSSTQIINSSLFGIQEAYTRFDNAQTKVNTGKQLQKPSDNPTGTAQTLEFRERVSELDQFTRNIDNAKNFISTSESALNSVTSLTQQARTIAVQASNGSISSDTRNSLSGQLQNVISQIASIANTTYGAQYVFAGQRTDTAPVVGTSSGYTYTGGSTATGDGDIQQDIGRNESIKVNATADQVLVPLLNTLSKVRDDISGGNALSVSNDLANIDTQLNTVLSARADLGSKVDRLTLTQSRNDIAKENYTKFISNIEDADIPSSIVELQTAQVAYQAALQATSHAFQNSLLDFIK